MKPYIPCKYVQNPYIFVQKILYLHYLSILYLYFTFATTSKVWYGIVSVAAIAGRCAIYRQGIGTCDDIDRMIYIEGIYINREKIGKEKEIEIYKRTIVGSREPVCVYE